MSTQAQIDANRANAQHSTGPRTEQGKAVSSQNAATHGFYAKAFVVRDEEREDFEALRDELHEGYNPVNGVADDLFQQILHASWNLFRLRRMENEIYATSANPFGDPDTLHKLDALRRHKGHFERALIQARKAYREHITSFWNLCAVPAEFRPQISPSVDVARFNRTQLESHKLYRLEDLHPKLAEKLGKQPATSSP